MSLNLEAESTLTDRYQTTVPEVVRQALQLKKGDRLRYNIQANGEVLISKAEISEENPFRDFKELIEHYAHDIANHPDRDKIVAALEESRLQTLKYLTRGLGKEISPIPLVETMLPPRTKTKE